MAFDKTTLGLYHTFSKTPVDQNPGSAAAQLGNAINKSGHTVQSSEVWAEAIPFYGKAGKTELAHKNLSATANTNDLVQVGSVLYQRNSTPAQFDASGVLTSTFNDLWFVKTTSIISTIKGEDGTYPTAPGALVDGSYLVNAEGKPVIRYYKDRLLTPLIDDNNANTHSQGWASRLKVDGRWVEQFVGATDAYVNGNAAVMYSPVIYRNKGDAKPLDAGSGKDYMDYCATGIILWDKQKTNITTNTAGEFTKATEVISCFEYVGKKLNASLTSLATDIEAINAQLGNSGPGTSGGIGERLSTIEGEVSTLKSTAQTQGGKISAIEEKLASTGEIGQAIADIKSTADSAVQSVSRAAGSSTLLTVTDGTNATISLSTEVATKSDAATAASTAITTSLNGTTTGTIGAAVADAKKAGTDAATALATAKNQTLAQTGTLSGMFSVTTAGTIGTGITGITISDTGLSTAIAAAKSGAEQTAATALATARGEITTEIGNAVSGLETKLTTGEGSLGAKVAALETATGTTLPAAIEQALTDAKAYSDSLHTTSLDYVVLGDSESLPTASADTLGKIYLVASKNAPTTDGSAISGSYVEYMTRKVSDTQYTWEKIGTTEADLSAYAKTADLNATNVGTGAVKVTQTNGKVSSVTVATEALVNNGAIKTSVADANALVKAGDALAAIKLAKPASYIKSVYVEESNSSSGEIDLKVTHFGGWDGTKMIFDEGTKSIGPSYHYAGKLAGYHLKGPERPVGFCNNTLIWGDETSNHFGFVYGNFIASNTYNTNNRDQFINTDKLVYLGNDGVFANNENLKFFKSNLDNVIDADRAFYNTSLSEFIVDMPSCETADEMFACWDGLTTLTTFIGDLSNLKKAKYMFKDQHNLRTFISDLSSLAVGMGMFSGCSLDTESVECIADTINTNISTSSRPLDGYGVIHIDIANTEPNAREIEAFNTIHSYNWELYVNGSLYNPTEPAAIATTDENGVTRTTPIPFYAKAVEVSEEENAEYIDNTGKFYRVLGGQYIYVNDPETYGMFTCLEDAVANMRLTKYVKPEVEA